MNAQAKIQTPYGREVRRAAAIRAVRDRYYREWFRIVADPTHSADRAAKPSIPPAKACSYPPLSQAPATFTEEQN